MGQKDGFSDVRNLPDTDNKSTGTPDTADDAFWSLPMIQKKTYQKPSFAGRTTDTIPISTEEEIQSTKNRKESIPPRDPSKAPATSRPVRPADRIFRTSTYATANEYANRLGDGKKEEKKQYGFSESDKSDDFHSFDQIPTAAKRSTAGEIITDRTGDGWLIRQVTIRRWINDFSFYSNFARDARISHNKPGTPADPVPFLSYVPQYANMDSRQLAFYLWFRDNARTGRFLEVDFAYVLLYIFEILNLPDLIYPTDGICILCQLWAFYRKKYPRLDVYLCEWLPDYALIHGVALPEIIHDFLPEIVRRAQFKEFYLDHMRTSDGVLSPARIKILAEVLLEAYSDYDYKKSRYYNGDNREQYDKCILDALIVVLTDAYQNKRGMFALDRVYRLTRDSFCGAIIETEGKRRIDVAFNSCIRSPETRNFVTGIVKYAENKLRFRLRIKSKLANEGISSGDMALVDAYFGPDALPDKQKKGYQLEEEAYLKQYEADSVGFDFSVANRIEADSWINTNRLTVDDTNAGPQILPDLAEEMSVDPAIEEVPDGAVSFDDTEFLFSTDPKENTELDTEPPIAESGEKPDIFQDVTETCRPHDTHTLEKEATAALLAGQYTAFCRDNGIFPGRMAEQINEIFLELVGDVLIEADGNQYHLIEDYREDAIRWSKTSN